MIEESTVPATNLVKVQVYLFIAFVIFLVLVIISGRILDDINNAQCQSDANLKNASQWTKWFLGISVAAMGLALIAFISIFFIKKN